MVQFDSGAGLAPSTRKAIDSLMPNHEARWDVFASEWRKAYLDAPKNLEAFFSNPQGYHHDAVASFRHRSGLMEYVQRPKVFSGPFAESICELIDYSQDNIPYFQNRNSPSTKIVPLVTSEELKTLLLYIAATRNYDDNYALMIDYWEDKLSISYAVSAHDIGLSFFDQQTNNPVLAFFESLGLLNEERKDLFLRLTSSRRFSESLTFSTEQITLLPPFPKDGPFPLTGTADAIFDYLRSHPMISRKQIAEALSLNDRTVGFHLSNLNRMGLLKIYGNGRSTLYSASEKTSF
jgi:DNA-binding transcriptional ArsR family regulator